MVKVSPLLSGGRRCRPHNLLYPVHNRSHVRLNSRQEGRFLAIHQRRTRSALQTALPLVRPSRLDAQLRAQRRDSVCVAAAVGTCLLPSRLVETARAPVRFGALRGERRLNLPRLEVPVRMRVRLTHPEVQRPVSRRRRFSRMMASPRLDGFESRTRGFPALVPLMGLQRRSGRLALVV